jgi:hypothetical protein
MTFKKIACVGLMATLVSTAAMAEDSNHSSKGPVSSTIANSNKVAPARTRFNNDPTAGSNMGVASPDASDAGANTDGSMNEPSDTARNAQSGSSTNTASTRSTADWNSENRYWRDNFSSRPYSKNQQYSEYEPAYRYGVESYNQNAGKRYEDINEAELKNGWERMKDKSKLSWERAKDAVKDAYNRVAGRSGNASNASNRGADQASNDRSYRSMNRSNRSERAAANSRVRNEHPDINGDSNR